MTTGLTRRLFMQLVGAAAVVTAAPAVIAAEPARVLPMLVGDGVHNDAPAINALLRGLPVSVNEELIDAGFNCRDGVMRFPGGYTFACHEPIILTGIAHFDGARLTFPDMQPGQDCISIEKGAQVHICHLELMVGHMKAAHTAAAMPVAKPHKRPPAWPVAHPRSALRR